MKATGLPARIAYAAIAMPASFAAGFAATVWALPAAGPWFGMAVPAARSEELFRLGLSVGTLLAMPAFLCALTLPWSRRRQRRGRRWRLAVSSVIVVTASLVFADAGHGLLYDLLFAAWLGYALALTFVRYGVQDYPQMRVYATEADED